MNDLPRQPDLSLIRPEIRAIKAYHVADASGFIKLDAMENPYRLPAALAQELGARLADVALNRYPPADPAGLDCPSRLHPDRTGGR